MKKFVVVYFIVLWMGIFCQEIPQPNHTVQIPMRDGKELTADLYYHPQLDPSTLPCLLMRNPAGRKSPLWLTLLDLAQHGYVIAVQDTRSALDTEGKTLPFFHDGWDQLQDGYDTVEWLAKSPYSNGQVGTMGFSAVGITQLMMAPSAPPSLKCQYIGQAASSLYHHGIYPGGQLRKNQVDGWLGLYARDTGIAGYIYGQPFYNDFWKSFDTLLVADRVRAPAIHYAGWFDTFVQGAIDGFVARQEKGGEGAKGKQKLLIGPWTHFWPFSASLGDFTVPQVGYVPPVDMTAKRWFDFHLKGISNDVDKIPAVTYFVMGPFDGTASSGNVWKHADRWPVPAEPTSLYLSADKKLSQSAPEKETKLAYQYDPANPVPTIGGRNLFLESGPKDQRPIEERSDTLVFTSDVLKEEIEVTGRILAKLWFSTDQEDTDLVVRLTDVYPDGKSILIADGICRLAVKHQDATPNECCETIVDLWDTSLVFAKGHRIRIAVTSSNYPRFEKNQNVSLVGTNKKSAIAQNMIYMGKNRPSQIILPVVGRYR